MQVLPTSVRRVACALLAVAFLGTTALLAGCGGERNGGPDSAARSEELTPGQFPAKRPTSATPPPPPQLRNPETAVYSYLLWISYAYRILNSEVATPTFSEFEEVRVNSYVQLNKQQGRAIDQRLLDVKVRGNESQGATATLAITETWAYRYIDIQTGEYSGPPYEVSYDSTYTVVNKGEDRWVVDRVVAESTSGEVK